MAQDVSSRPAAPKPARRTQSLLAARKACPPHEASLPLACAAHARAPRCGDGTRTTRLTALTLSDASPAGPDLNLGYDGEERVLADSTVATVTEGGYAPISMVGKEVYKFATTCVPSVLGEALDNAGVSADDIDWLVLHQANIRIMETVAKKLGIPMEKASASARTDGLAARENHWPYTRQPRMHTSRVLRACVRACVPVGSSLCSLARSWPQVITNLDEYGNTSAGSIPLALDAAVRDGKVKEGDTLAVAGFGAGLSWGAAVIRWG